MVLTEIFREAPPENTDNAKCGECHASFTVPFVAAKLNSSLACPNCGASQKAKDAIANNSDVDQSAPDSSDQAGV